MNSAEGYAVSYCFKHDRFFYHTVIVISLRTRSITWQVVALVPCGAFIDVSCTVDCCCHGDAAAGMLQLSRQLQIPPILYSLRWKDPFTPRLSLKSCVHVNIHYLLLYEVVSGFEGPVNSSFLWFFLKVTLWFPMGNDYLAVYTQPQLRHYCNIFKEL